jgi:hypothetical protein
LFLYNPSLLVHKVKKKTVQEISDLLEKPAAKRGRGRPRKNRKLFADLEKNEIEKK